MIYKHDMSPVVKGVYYRYFGRPIFWLFDPDQQIDMGVFNKVYPDSTMGKFLIKWKI